MKTAGDVRVKIFKVLFDPRTESAVVVLQDEKSGRSLPIWIGQTEALSIAMAVEKVELARPMTHDLVRSLFDALGLSVEWVRIHSLREGTFYAMLRVGGAAEHVDIDSRPSDAIAIAVRMNAPVFVAECVFADALLSGEALSVPFDKLSEEFLADLPDTVFGKYKM